MASHSQSKTYTLKLINALPPLPSTQDCSVLLRLIIAGEELRDAVVTLDDVVAFPELPTILDLLPPAKTNNTNIEFNYKKTVIILNRQL